MHPFGQILHKVNQKIYFISHDSQLAQLDSQSMKCELLPFKGLESIQSHKNLLVGVSGEGSLFLLKHIPNRATPATMQISIKRDFYFIKAAVYDEHVVVFGWSEERKEAIYMLYDSRLSFKDEIIVEQSTLRLNRQTSELHEIERTEWLRSYFRSRCELCSSFRILQRLRAADSNSIKPSDSF